MFLQKLLGSRSRNNKKPNNVPQARRLRFEPLESRELLSVNPDIIVRVEGNLNASGTKEPFYYYGNSFVIPQTNLQSNTGISTISGSLTQNSRSAGMASNEYVFSTQWYASNANSGKYLTQSQNSISGSIAVWVKGDANIPYHLEASIKGTAVGSCNFSNLYFTCQAAAPTWRRVDGNGATARYNQSNSVEYNFVTDAYNSYYQTGGGSSYTMINGEPYRCIWWQNELGVQVSGLAPGANSSWSGEAQLDITIKAWIKDIPEPEIAGIVISSDNPTTGKDLTFTAFVPATFTERTGSSYSGPGGTGNTYKTGTKQYASVCSLEMHFIFGNYYGDKFETVTSYTTYTVNFDNAIPGLKAGTYLGFRITITPIPGTHSLTTLDKDVWATLRYQNRSTGKVGYSDKQEKFTLFFDKMGDDNGNGVKNWFEYWARDQATSHGYLNNVVYGGSGSYLGSAQRGTGTITLYDGATSQETNWDLPWINVPVSELKGIDLVENVLTHELLHRYLTQWVVVRLNNDPRTDMRVSSMSALEIFHYRISWPRAKFLSQAQLDFGVEDSDGDTIPDNLELELWNLGFFFDPNNTHTFSSVVGGAEYFSRDQEVLARLVSLGLVNIPQITNYVNANRSGYPKKENDFANPGKNTTPAFSCIEIPETGEDASLTGVYRERISVDKKSLQFDIEVEVRDAGYYTVFANLYDENRRIYSAENYVWLETGTQNVTLSFDGTLLRQSRFEGALSLENIILFGAAFEDFDGEPYKTRPLAWTDFAAPVAEISGDITQVTTQADSEGTLQFQVPVRVNSATNFTLEAFLCDENGDMIDHFKVAGRSYAVGDHTLTLTFDNETIRRSRAGGKFSLQYVKITDNNGNDIDFLFRPLETAPFARSDFGLSPVELSGRSEKWGIDTDQSGIIDTIRFEAGVSVHFSDSYTIFAELLDREGNSIENIVFTTDLFAGQTVLELLFTSEEIAAQNSVSDFRLGRVTVYSTDDFQLIDSFLDVAPRVVYGDRIITVQQGCSVPIPTPAVSYRGGGTLTYYWDFDGDGIYDTSGDSLWFTAGKSTGYYQTASVIVLSESGLYSAPVTYFIEVLKTPPTYYVAGPEELTAGQFSRWEFEAVDQFSAIRDWEIDWGDGSEPTQILGGPRSRINVTHYFAEADTYTITITTTDFDGLVTTVTIGPYEVKERVAAPEWIPESLSAFETPEFLFPAEPTMVSLAAPLHALSENCIGNDLADLTETMRQRQMLNLDQSGQKPKSVTYPELIWDDDLFGDEWLDFTEQEENGFWSKVFEEELIAI